MKPEIIPVNFGFVKSFLIKGDKTIIVDAGLKGSSRKILYMMKAHGIMPDNVSLLLVTHVHGDHTGGLKALQEATGAPVAVHVSEAMFLAEGASATVVLHSPMMKLLSGIMKRQKIGGVHPDVLIDGKLDLNKYGVDGYVFGTPGHTDGSVTLVTADGRAVVGDMVGGGATPALPGVYSDLAMLKASIASLEQNKITTIFTSHGRVYDIADALKLSR